MAEGERKSEPEDDACMLGAAVAASGESLQEVVAAGEPDLPLGEVFERRHDEDAHVSLVQGLVVREKRSPIPMSSSQ